MNAHLKPPVDLSSDVTPWVAALDALLQQRKLLDIAHDDLLALQLQGEGDPNFIVARIADCRQKIRTKDKEIDIVRTTHAVSVGPTESEIAKLRDAVSRLQQQNATAATIKAIVDEVFTLADAVLHKADMPAASIVPQLPLPQPMFERDVAPQVNIGFVRHAAVQATVRSGRYQGTTPELAIELRVGGDDGIVSADLFRLSTDNQRTWVASLRSALGQSFDETRIPLRLEDRYGASTSGWLRLTTATCDALHCILFIDGALDGLPLRYEIAFSATYAGAGLRSLGLEIEMEKGVDEPPESTYQDAKISVTLALARAGIDTHQVGRRDVLPEAPAEGWSEKDIESLMRSAGQIDFSSRAFSLQVLWLSKSNRPGLLGVMFDTNDDRPRQSVAIFASAIREFVGNDAVHRDRKLIQTTVHEIGHALNLAHRFEREVGRADSTSCMNYDWRYRGGNREAEYWQQFAYGFDADELAFLRHAPYAAIVQGGAAFHSVRYWSEGTGGYSPYVPEQALRDLKLELLPPQQGRVFSFAQPVLLGLRLTNLSNAAITVPASLLDPKAGFVELLIKRVSRGRQSQERPESFKPVVARCFDLAQEATQRLGRGQSMEDNVNPTFGAAGFSFAEPGDYEVQALLVMYDNVRNIDRIAPSNPLLISIGYPQDSRDYEVADLVLNADAGRWFALGAPERLDATGQKLVDFAQAKATQADARMKGLRGSILRAAMFGAARGSHKKVGMDLWKRVEGDHGKAQQYAGELKSIGLGFLDEVTRKQTESYLQTLEPAEGGGRTAAVKPKRPPRP
jgi:hypothetical protein